MVDLLIDLIVSKVYNIIEPYRHIDDKNSFYESHYDFLRGIYNKPEVFDIEMIDLVGMLIYVDRLSEIRPDTYLSHYNKRYILLTLFILYCKMNKDFFYDNRFYSELTQTNLKIVNYTEKQILSQIFLFIDVNEFNAKISQVMCYPRQ